MRHWYTRYEISNALDRGDLAAVLTRGHAARCAACQGFAERLQAQHAQLVGGAAVAKAPVVARPRRAGFVLAPLALGAAVALAVALTARPAAVPAIAVAPPRVEILPAEPRVAARVSELFATASEPLDAELRHLLSDGRRGVDAVLATGGLRGLAN